MKSNFNSNENKTFWGTVHPLISEITKITGERYLISLAGQEVFLSDHRIDEMIVFPGAAYLEIICAAVQILGLGKVKKIISCIIAKPLIDNGSPLEIELLIKLSAEGIISFKICSRSDTDENAAYAQGKVLCAESQSSGSEGGTVDIQAVKQRCVAELDKKDCYEILRRHGLNYGHAFKTISRYLFSKNEALSLLELPESLRGNSKSFKIHPSLIDGAFQSVMGLMGRDTSDTYVPFILGEININGTIPDLCYAHVTTVQEDQRETSISKFNIEILDMSGNIIININNFCMKRMSTEASDKGMPDTILYSRTECPENICKKAKSDVPVLIFNTDNDDADYLTKLVSSRLNETSVITVSPGANYQKHGNNSYIADINDCGSYTRLIKDITAEYKTFPSKIILMPFGMKFSNKELPEFSRLFSLSQALIKEKIKNNVEIITICLNGPRNDSSFNIAADGFNKTLSAECRNLHGIIVGIKDYDKKYAERTAGIIADEIECDHEKESCIIWKDGERFCVRYREIRQHDEADSGCVLKQNGVYLITGGMGGLGFILAKYLSENFSAKLILSGRSPMSVNYIKKINELESYGAKAAYIAGNIADEGDAKRVLDIAHSLYGNINGIFHCAGTIRDALITKKTIEETSEVIAPKVFGTLNLDENTKEDKLDFFVLFSSAAAAFGNVGQSDYAYANSFMDYFAQARELKMQNGMRSGKTVSINWPLWKDGGMAVDPQICRRLEAKTGLGILETKTALKALKQILNLGLTNVVVVTGSRQKLMDSFNIAGADEKTESKNNSEFKEQDQVKSPAFDNNEAAARIVKVFSELLDVSENEIDIHTELSDYGFSSIMLMTLLDRLEEQYGEPVEPNDVLNFSTISDYAEYLSSIKKPSGNTTFQAEVDAGLKTVNGGKIQSSASDKSNAATQLVNIFSKLLNVSEKEIDADTDLTDYGFSSIMLMALLDRLEDKFGKPVEPNDVLNFNTISEYADYIVSKGMTGTAENNITGTAGQQFLNTESGQTFKSNKKKCGKIALIAAACRFPGANSTEKYWANLKSGVSSIKEVPKDRFDIEKIFSTDKSKPGSSYSKWGGFIDDIYNFDAGFFGISESEALILDPQQRIILELSQELFERAGYSKDELSNTDTAVYLSARESSYLKSAHIPDSGMKHVITSLIQNMIAARVSDFYNLRGTSQIVDTACSSSLVAVHMACESIKNDEAEAAVAGGIDLILDEFPFIAFSKAGVLSDDKNSYVFDNKAKGFVLGEGAGLVLLKSYDAAIRDGDSIIAVIDSSAVNNDGHTNGLTVPNQQAQKEVIEKALKSAEISAEDISYLEAHGTGTLLGDPIEVKAASLAFREYTQARSYCAIGSVKANIGHLQRAAGIASLIKVAEALKNRFIPPTLNCDTPHKRFKFNETPFYPVTGGQRWDAGEKRRIAGISSFGFGGTNCHVIMEEFIPPEGYTLRRTPLPAALLNKKYYRIDDTGSGNTAPDSSKSEIAERQFEKTVPTENAAGTDMRTRIEVFLKNKIARLINTEADEIERGLNFMDMGIESGSLIRLTDEISDELNIELYPTVFFEYQNINEMTDFLYAEYSRLFEIYFQKYSTKEAAALVKNEPIPHDSDKKINENTGAVNSNELNESAGNDIAIIGMSGLFAGSPDLQAFWRNIKDGRDLIKEIPRERFSYSQYFDREPQKQDKMYCKWGSFIDNVDIFDADLFHISPREAETMDPQLRLLLEVLYSAAEDAGYINKLRGSNTGIFVGACYRDYLMEMNRFNRKIGIYDGTGNSLSMLANRPAFYFDLKGPAMSLDTACSSSLVSLHLAVNALRAGECDTAYAAGVNIILSSWRYRYFSSIGALSPTGRCHTFDEKADGYVPGEGVAALLLKPLDKALKDGDRIHAVIKGTAVNSGGYTSSVTAPSVNLESQVIIKAWKNAGINPETISYIEAHGTGTKLGDPIEIEAVTKAFAAYTKKQSFCAIGSVKANIGHTEGAAGITGIIKTVLSMKNGIIPSMPGFSKVNPYIKLKDSPLYINRENISWPQDEEQPFRAGVSSFGYGGTYAHVVLEEYRCEQPRLSKTENRRRVFVISAKTDEQLKLYSEKLLAWADGLKSSGKIKLIPDEIDAKGVLSEKLASEIRNMLSEVTGITVENISTDVTAEDMGIDEVIRSGIISKLNDRYNLELPYGIYMPQSDVRILSEEISERYGQNIKIYGNNENRTLSEYSTVNLDDAAWTLQTGREHMEERLAFSAESWHQFAEKIRAFIKFGSGAAEIYRASVTCNEMRREPGFTEEDYATDIGIEKIAEWWTKGVCPDWGLLYSEHQPSIVTMPNYPFAGQSFWFKDDDADDAPSQMHGSAVLKGRNTPSQEPVAFSETLNNDSAFLSGHRINGKGILPGAVCIEIMRAAGEAVCGKPCCTLSDINFISPIRQKQSEQELKITLYQKSCAFMCEIGGESNEIFACSKIETSCTDENKPEKADIQAIISSMEDQIPGYEIYNQFEQFGFKVSGRSRAVSAVYLNGGEALAKLELLEKTESEEYYLNPFLVDGAFHCSLLLMNSSAPVFLTHIDQIKVFGPLPHSCFAHVVLHENSDTKAGADIKIYDKNGNLAILIKNVRGEAANTGDLGKKQSRLSQQPECSCLDKDFVMMNSDELARSPELRDAVDRLFNRYAREEASAALKEISPYIFIPADKSCCAYCNRSDSILAVFNYMGPDEKFAWLIKELVKYCDHSSLEFELITDRKQQLSEFEDFTATVFAAVQRITDLKDFSLTGRRMSKLRYMVSKFQSSGVCTTEEYTPGTAKSIDNEILTMIDTWCKTKTTVNTYVKHVKKQIENARLSRLNRVFLTRLDGSLQNVIIITRMPAGGYLMDMEFYRSDMPLGSLEFAISTIIKKLVNEGCGLYSLGVTWGIPSEHSYDSDMETEKILQELREQNIFNGNGNYQFKNKFRPQNTPLYLVHPKSNSASNVEEIIMMIASPEERNEDFETKPLVACNEDSGNETQVPVASMLTDNENPEFLKRRELLHRYGNNPMLIPPQEAEIDFVTDSWAELSNPQILSRIEKLQHQDSGTEKVLKEIFPFSNVILTGSGRMAESLLYERIAHKSVVIENLLFPTGIFNQINNGLKPVEIPKKTVFDVKSPEIFKGNIDCVALSELLKSNEGKIAFACIEVGNNASGGCPLSLANLEAAKALLKSHNIPLVIDATRIIENAFFISLHESGYKGRDIWDIVREILGCADYAAASLTKDFSVDVGGIIATDDDDVCADIRSRIAASGGGIGAIKSREIISAMSDKDYLAKQVKERMEMTRLLWNSLDSRNVPVARPCGGHCVLIDISKFVNNSQLKSPLLSFLAWFYCCTGVRASAHNSGLKKETELANMIRLAVPLGTQKSSIVEASEKICGLFEKKSAFIPNLIIKHRVPGLFSDAKSEYEEDGYVEIKLN
ncbi:MAG TPA: SDR family NAD(P)-dependent oxidoreductase [Ruminiclostridium sp.]|nr:SDR family NAD(P)-dependent oxidoreductase [Ruminiclostridium sp.]